jgi:hypothetical protein
MPLPALVIAPLVGAAPWIARVLVKWAWSPLVVFFGYMVKTRLGLFIASAFIWLGINFSTIKLVIEPAVNALQAYSSGVGSSGGQFTSAAIAYLGILNFDKALTMIISAVVTKHGVMQGRLFLFKRGVGA